MRKYALIAALSAITAVVGLNGQTAHAQTENDNKPAAPQQVVQVQPGDSLSNIATAHTTTYVRLYDANAEIQDPNVIHPGQNIRIPAAEEQIPSRPLPSAAPVAAAAPASATTQPQRAAKSRAQTQAAAPNYSSGGTVWDQIAKCESGGNWSINTGNGYYGGLQFSLGSWRAVGGSGLPSEASREEQIVRGEMLKARQGWGAWPSCTSKLGLR